MLIRNFKRFLINLKCRPIGNRVNSALNYGFLWLCGSSAIMNSFVASCFIFSASSLTIWVRGFGLFGSGFI